MHLMPMSWAHWHARDLLVLAIIRLQGLTAHGTAGCNAHSDMCAPNLTGVPACASGSSCTQNIMPINHRHYPGLGGVAAICSHSIVVSHFFPGCGGFPQYAPVFPLHIPACPHMTANNCCSAKLCDVQTAHQLVAPQQQSHLHPTLFFNTLPMAQTQSCLDNGFVSVPQSPTCVSGTSSPTTSLPSNSGHSSEYGNSIRSEGLLSVNTTHCEVHTLPNASSLGSPMEENPRMLRQLPVPPRASTFLPSAHQVRALPAIPSANSQKRGMHFLDSSYVRLDQSNLTNVGGNLNYTISYESGAKQSGRDILLPNIDPGAIHGKEHQSDNHRGIKRIRYTINMDIKSWIETKDRIHNVLWLTGPAGTGKTTLMKMVVADLKHADSSTKVAGSFFFCDGDSTRSTLDRLVPTLAYQLTRLTPDVGQRIDEALNKDPHILTSELDNQWWKLVIEPLTGVSGSLPPAVFIIDGLDQCTPFDQSEILHLIASCGPAFPIAFLISSRPEYHIRTDFRADSLAMLCRKAINLSDIPDVEIDIKAFLRSRLAEIHARNRDIAGPVPLVTEAFIQDLARRSAGHYVYASAFLKFIDDHHANPRARVEQYMNRHREAAAAYGRLDGYYGQVLSKSHHPSNTFVQNILFHILHCTQTRLASNLTRIAALEGCNTRLIRTALRPLHSVFDVPDDDGTDIRIYDPSFLDYLYDHERSGPYYIDSSYYAALAVVQCLKNLSLRSNNRHSQWWFDNSHGWIDYMTFTNLVNPAEDFVFALQQFNFQQWLNEYARQPFSLHKPYATIHEVLKRSPMGQYLIELSPDALIEARRGWLAELCSHNFEVGRIYLQLLGRLPLVPRLPSWSAIHSLVSTHFRLSLSSLQVDTTWPLFCYPVEEVVPSVPGWFMGDEKLAQQFAFTGACMSQHDVALATLTLLHFPTYPSSDDLDYFSAHWSSHWDADSDDLWLNISPQQAPTKAKIHAILGALRRLPNEFHKHALHSQNVLTWIETYAPDATDLLDHWQADQCAQAMRNWSRSKSSNSGRGPQKKQLNQAQETEDFASELWAAFQESRNFVPNRKVNDGRMSYVREIPGVGAWSQTDHIR